jgi:hypothetical protein
MNIRSSATRIRTSSTLRQFAPCFDRQPNTAGYDRKRQRARMVASLVKAHRETSHR